MKRKIALTILLSLLLVGCAGRQQYVLHPGAVDEFGSRTYDVLVSVKASLDQAKIEYRAGTLPSSSKDLLNRIGASYNLTRDAWLAYRDYHFAGDGTEEGLEAIRAKIRALLPHLLSLQQELGTLIRIGDR